MEESDKKSRTRGFVYGESSDTPSKKPKKKKDRDSFESRISKFFNASLGFKSGNKSKDE